jgi:transglutaminase-like putative cysteine protease
METRARERLAVGVGCDFTFEAGAPTPAVFLVRPELSDVHTLGSERWEADPPLAFSDYTDLYGNRCRRLVLPPGRAHLHYEARVETLRRLDPVDLAAPELSSAELPDDVLIYTMPSRYCLSDVLADRAWQHFGALPPGWSRVQAISDFVHDHLGFAYGSSTPTTTALDAYENRAGVCRDFAHLMIAFARALNIPARYAFGYLPDIDVVPPDTPMDFCAWCEVYLGDRWWTFDPRNNERRTGRTVIARGRDAVDVAMVTTYGTVNLQEMLVRADEIT